MKNSNFPWALIAAAAVAGAGFAGVASYVRQDGSKPSNVTQNLDDSSNTTVETDPLSGNKTGSDNGSTATKNGDTSENSNQALRVSKVDTLNKAIKANSFDQKGIRVLDVTVENGNAIIDMNNSVRYNWGSEEETAFIDTLRDALTRFTSIQTFQIRVDGEILKFLSHFEVNPVKVR
jgi:hypothetical protein